MADFSILDYWALGFFIVSWLAYHLALEFTGKSRRSLNSQMYGYRHKWLEQAAARENRIVDTTIMASLQNGTAFFASTSLFAIGGALALFKVTDDILPMIGQMPLGAAMTRFALEAKAMGLTVILIYSFFKFSWAYRLFNFSAILLGSIPQPHEDKAILDPAVRRAGRMCVAAGKNFSRGQRAFFFALAYLGWFIGAKVFLLSTVAVLIVMTRRQFDSEALRALRDDG